MSPVGPIFMPFLPKTGTNMLHHRPPAIVELVEHRGDFTQKADLVCGICGAHGGYETAEVRDVRRNGGGRGLCGGPGKRVDAATSELSASTPTSGRLQPRTRGNGAERQNKGGTFHGKMDRCRKKQGGATACSSMPERDGRDQGEDIPKQAGSCWFARPC